MKKVLILSVKVGYGHHATAQAIADYLEALGVECEMLDSFEYISHFLSDAIQDGYLQIAKLAPGIYGSSYDKMDKKSTESNKFSPITVSSKMVSKKLKEYITDFAPDAIIGTHSYASMLITYMKRKGYISCPTYGVITDFTVHPLWENTELDYYVTPSELIMKQFVRKGIAEEKVLPFGIPIKPKFAKKLEKAEACRQLGIENKTTILIMGGSLGLGNIQAEMEKIDSVPGDFQILCVCGTNEKSRQAILAKEWKKKIHVYGFVDVVDVMMDASDCIVTKPGGLTSSEFMAKGLPAILINPMPGHEDRNLEFMVNAGVAVMTTKTFPIDEALNMVINTPWRMEQLKKSIAALGKPEATKTLCEFIINNF